MFLRVLLPLVATLATPQVFGKKVIWPFIEVTFRAELIVVGSIRSVGLESYAFTIDEVVYGDTSLRSIRVEKWRQWRCDRRTPYRAGQRFMLFLAPEGDHWSSINASTGEAPINASDSVRIRWHDVGFALDEFKNALKLLRSCYRLNAQDVGRFVAMFELILQRQCTVNVDELVASGDPSEQWLFGWARSRELH